MIEHLIDKIKATFRKAPVPQETEPETPAASEEVQILIDTDEPLLEDAFGKFVLNIDEAGDFALAVDFKRIEGDNNADISAYVIHMINSGQMAEFFVEALNIWAEEVEQKRFALSVIKKWRELYTDALDSEQKPLAVDPSEVFGMRRGSSK